MRVSRPSLTVSPGVDLHARVDPRRDRVAPDLAVEELVGAEALDHVDLHLHRGRLVDDAIGDRLRPEAERALARAAPACGSLTEKPEALAVPFSESSTGTKFIVGLPMKPATNRLAGWS